MLIIPEDFASDLFQARTAEIELVRDGTKKDVGASIGRAHSLVESYGRVLMGRLRLIARGISPQLGSPYRWKRSTSPASASGLPTL